MAAHEMRSPLTCIKGYLTAIKDGVVSDEGKDKYLGIAIEEADKLIDLLEQVMTISRLDEMLTSPQKEDFDISELIRRVIIEKYNDIEAKGHSISAELPDGAIAFADKLLIKKVIANLVENAIKYTPQGGNITVSMHDDGDKFVITVRDTGVGIKAEDLPHIWDSFYRSTANDPALYKGHGLGLSIVKEILTSHGESIWVESEYGKGTAFRFTLSKQK